jgi:hypothetical protein
MHSWRCILFARVVKRSLAYAFLLFPANLSVSTNHILFYIVIDCCRDSSRVMGLVVSFVHSHRQFVAFRRAGEEKRPESLDDARFPAILSSFNNC